MTKAEINSDYIKRKSEFAALLSETKDRINLISNLRLLMAVVFIILLYYSFTFAFLGFGVAIAAALFFVLVKRHSILFQKKTHLEHLVEINTTESQVLKGDSNSLFAGKTFIDPHHPYTHDLDIFGEGSLYQYVNRCNTLNGQKALAERFENPVNEKKQIYHIQEGIRDMAPRIDFRQHFQAAGMETNELPGDMKELESWLKNPSIVPTKKKFEVILYLVPLLTLAALTVTILSEQFRIILFPLIIVQWVMSLVYLKKINLFHEQISKKKIILEKYSLLLFYLERENFSSPGLKDLAAKAHEAFENVTKLASLVSALNARSNALVTLFVNSFLLYDLHCVFRLEKWKAQNAKKLPDWFEAITEAEVLNSFSTFFYNNPTFRFASIGTELSVKGTALAHPLIDEAERIANDFSIGPNPSVLIITGANMAGKSTFLRTLGVNLVLALNGAPVCASSFECPVINLRSGMRTADSLKDHQSYFFAELNRLKSIMDELRNQKPLLILLDEILKGTNSNDKQTGSIALVKQFLPYPCLALIATHDLALGDLEVEYPEKVKNYCFEATIENDQLSFDYKLKQGLAEKMNASFLMKKMGIIPK